MPVLTFVARVMDGLLLVSPFGGSFVLFVQRLGWFAAIPKAFSGVQ